jgi:hypothetical protein
MPVIVLRLLDVQPVFNDRPTHCPYCGNEVFQRWGALPKKAQDTNNQKVEVFRYHCNICGHTFRNYPQEADCTNLTERLHKLAGLVWALGLSSREVVSVFNELGIEMSHMTVWREGNELVHKYFDHTGPDSSPRYKIDKIFLKYRGSVIGTIIILDLGKDKKVVLGKVDEANPRVLLAWLEPIVHELHIQALVCGTDILDQYHFPSAEALTQLDKL